MEYNGLHLFYIHISLFILYQDNFSAFCQIYDIEVVPAWKTKILAYHVIFYLVDSNRKQNSCYFGEICRWIGSQSF